MNITFENKCVLITGATGYLGKELVEKYANSGAKALVLVDHISKKQELDIIVSEYNSILKVEKYCVDICDISQVEGFVRQLVIKDIKIDILVNNAGINILKKALEMDEITWDILLNTNLKGSFFLTKMIAKSSLIAQEGNIIFVSSQHGVVGNVSRAAYCSSKTAIIGLVKALVAEWSKFGVRINAVSPTYILNKSNEDYLTSSSAKRNMLSKIPLNKYATVTDVANAVLFLTSENASMINGHNLIIDGGYTVL